MDGTNWRPRAAWGGALPDGGRRIGTLALRAITLVIFTAGLLVLVPVEAWVGEWATRRACAALSAMLPLSAWWARAGP